MTKEFRLFAVKENIAHTCEAAVTHVPTQGLPWDAVYQRSDVYADWFASNTLSSVARPSTEQTPNVKPCASSCLAIMHHRFHYAWPLIIHYAWRLTMHGF
jgi:hypothetical protein